MFIWLIVIYIYTLNYMYFFHGVRLKKKEDLIKNNNNNNNNNKNKRVIYNIIMFQLFIMKYFIKIHGYYL